MPSQPGGGALPGQCASTFGSAAHSEFITNHPLGTARHSHRNRSRWAMRSHATPTSVGAGIRERVASDAANGDAKGSPAVACTGPRVGAIGADTGSAQAAPITSAAVRKPINFVCIDASPQMSATLNYLKTITHKLGSESN